MVSQDIIYHRLTCIYHTILTFDIFYYSVGEVKHFWGIIQILSHFFITNELNY